MDILLVVLGLTLTVAIFSYLLGDNPLYRLAVHLLVGVSAAYAGVIALREVIVPALVTTAEAPTAVSSVLWLVPLFLALLLLVRTLSPLAWVGQSAVAALVGIGAAVALVGAIAGTLLPQALAPGTNGPLLGLATAILTVLVLFTFNFRPVQQNRRAQNGIRRAVLGSGKVVLTISFGVLFAGALGTGLTLLTERVSFVLGLLGL
jgi:hypothetical protein